MSATEWLIANRLGHLVQSIGHIGTGMPESSVQQVLDGLWRKAKKGRQPEALFKVLVEREAEDAIGRASTRDSETTWQGLTMEEVSAQVVEWRRVLEGLDPNDLYNVWVWVDERTRFANGDKLSDREPDPLGNETNIWHIGRAVQFYGLWQVTKWGRKMTGRPPFEQCLEILRKELGMPNLGRPEEERS